MKQLTILILLTSFFLQGYACDENPTEEMAQIKRIILKKQLEYVHHEQARLYNLRQGLVQRFTVLCHVKSYLTRSFFRSALISIDQQLKVLGENWKCLSTQLEKATDHSGIVYGHKRNRSPISFYTPQDDYYRTMEIDEGLELFIRKLRDASYGIENLERFISFNHRGFFHADQKTQDYMNNYNEKSLDALANIKENIRQLQNLFYNLIPLSSEEREEEIKKSILELTLDD